MSGRLPPIRRGGEVLKISLRFAGSVIFAAAGAFYILAPPLTTSNFFDSEWPAILWGMTFFFGGIISAIGTSTQRPHIERFGVLAVAIAAFCLTAGQTMVMLDDAITWTRGGGTLVYFGLGMWALDRYIHLSADVSAMNAIKEGGDANQ